MNAATAKDDILDRALSITPDQFEQLCRILIKRSEKTRELELTPRSGDDGIDVHAVVDRDLFQARLGVQATCRFWEYRNLRCWIFGGCLLRPADSELMHRHFLFTSLAVGATGTGCKLSNSDTDEPMTDDQLNCRP